jgi:acetyl esterase/lipase
MTVVSTCKSKQAAARGLLRRSVTDIEGETFVQGRLRIILVVTAVMAGLIGLLVASAYAFAKVSPWPMALMARYKWDRSGLEMNRALDRFVPDGVASRLNIPYSIDDGDVRLDVYYPSTIERTDRLLPVVVWTHGGSWISGSKELVSNYLKVLASKGFTVVGVGYTLAPARLYPTPVRQLNAALDFIEKNGQALHADPSRIFLAGSSAGAQIAAQLANAITSPSYAATVGIKPSIKPSQLMGVVFHCGTYEAKLANFGRRGVLWAYFGTMDFATDPRLSQFSVARHVTSEFPATFVSAGNEDALAPQSYLFADNLAKQGVFVDRLFFPQEYMPKVWHEFQFNLDSEAGRLALERSVAFMTDRLKQSGQQPLNKRSN